MYDKINALVEDFASLVWGLPLLILLIGGGFFLLVYSRFLPFRYLGHALQVLRGKYDNKEDEGEISHFQALTTALSSTIGMGNIAGVAVAISIGGPGAVFWMWVSAIIGMSTKFFTSSLAIMYRGKDSAGNTQGGPMYFIMEGLGKKWKPLAIFFSLCGLIGALPVFNVNQLTQAINDIVLKPNGVLVNFTSNLIIGIILVSITSIVILGGLNRISKVASKLVPSMVLLYFGLVLFILFVNAEVVPTYFKLIFTDAFAAENYTGDSFLGGVLGGLIILGIRRGAFSNEAGIGTAPLAHGAAKTNEPIREGLVAMLGPAIDTLVVCTLTALAILVTGVWQTTEANGVSLTANAFGAAMPEFGRYLLLLCIVVFSVSSLFSYAYYGGKCLSFLVGDKNKHYYNYFYILSIILGATTSLALMINLIDGVFALMAIPTMTATLILAPKVLVEAKAYFRRLKDSKIRK
ncbi:sodium:alanine symporter family protein [Oceanihabitans sediminis]|uniref:Alanine:cation symporter family protein n=1 Tax=Oceanihabitans sediminis TaxID=1812012 RepID=A0A368P4Z7_9FLAO|nr:alanine/glycine:cation symporter family protein [Oceanihabitans sediminis]MDX1278481.1 alanine/glycine:cation symporter family protein [Oceanihabitans sediminis]MDX1773537.1 alanine/glycine:cation symporter family protein [Oceanihabitans sediminis]RBP32976.1 AGCS family alanine or glycine:cation symporter [Oceanihabitans sediminis]RCU57506.1 alanine:cation symporter family protein [Oceanihabitans sediminis]